MKQTYNFIADACTALFWLCIGVIAAYGIAWLLMALRGVL